MTQGGVIGGAQPTVTARVRMKDLKHLQMPVFAPGPDAAQFVIRNLKVTTRSARTARNDNIGDDHMTCQMRGSSGNVGDVAFPR